MAWRIWIDELSGSRKARRLGDRDAFGVQDCSDGVPFFGDSHALKGEWGEPEQGRTTETESAELQGKLKQARSHLTSVVIGKVKLVYVWYSKTNFTRFKGRLI